MTPRLSAASIGVLPAAIAPLRYERRLLSAGVAHIGVGAFHRAHQLDYLDDLAARGETGWGVWGVSLRSEAAERALAPQECLYVLNQRGRGGDSLALRGALLKARTAGEDPTPVLRILTAPEIALVTLTLTEKAYVADPDDFAVQARPTTAIGYLTLGLAMRRALGLAPFTVVSCDNLAANGETLRGLVLAAAASLDPGLADWIAETGAFPNSMVDRITPAATDADRARLAMETGIDDRALTVTEPFRQWVIEDRFVGDRPPLEDVGVQIVADVAPWEAAKLRLLNAAHSALAWVGLLMGLRYVHEAIAAAAVRAFIDRLWDEAAETLPRDGGPELTRYRADLLDRFDNPGLPHSLLQIAADSSRKLPPRMLAALAERRACGLASPALTLAVAAWLKLQRGRDDAGAEVAFADPAMAGLRPILSAQPTPEGMVTAAMAARDLFPVGLAEDPAFKRDLSDRLGGLLAQGMRAALA